jgi:Flp pilus assembly protein TadB
LLSLEEVLVTVPLLAALGTLFGVGLVLVAGGLGLLRLSSRTHGAADGAENAALAATTSGTDRRVPYRHLGIAALCGGVALAVTRWPMALPLGILAVLGSRGVTGAATTITIDRLEAIAAWTEMLRDTLAGAAGLTQALTATAPIAPRPIRPQMAALVARLHAGVPVVAALVQLADDLDDPAADTVVACLVLAASERAQRLAELLGALAATTREEVAMRLGVEAARASARTSVRMITGFSFGMLGLMAVFARSYLSPYRTANGQLVLAVVGCIYGLGLWLMAVMVRPKPFPRLHLNAARVS